MNRLIGSHVIVIIVVALIGIGGYYMQWYLDRMNHNHGAA
jgi:hypothetical protein